MGFSTQHLNGFIRNEALLLFNTAIGDPCYLYRDSLVIELLGRRKVVSSSSINGGTRDDIQFIFNNSCSKRREVVEKINCPMQENNLREYYQGLCRNLGLPLDTTVGMNTAARIENYGVASRCYHNVEVMVVATAGIDVNGGRAGDKATYNEFEHKDILPAPGTINMMIFINAHLDGGVLTRVLVTATEAKTVVLQELMAGSRYSEGIATGSGTDTIVAVCNEESEVELFDAGKHVILGEMIGEATIEALRDALNKQSGMNAQRQSSIEWQGGRYGITRQRIVDSFQHLFPQKVDAKLLNNVLSSLDQDNRLVGIMASVLHLCDQNKWGIITDETLTILAEKYITLISQQQEYKQLSQSKGYKGIVQKLIKAFAYQLYGELNK